MGLSAHDVIQVLYWVIVGMAGNMAHDTFKWWMRNRNKQEMKET